MAVLPLATGAAILRYRLYDIDRIVSRTLAYALLTVLLGLGYAAVTLGLGRLLGQNSSLAVAAATPVVAAAFQPLRRRVQTVEAFSARLREQIDLSSLAEQTMQPTQVSLWLRPHPHGMANPVL